MGSWGDFAEFCNEYKSRFSVLVRRRFEFLGFVLSFPVSAARISEEKVSLGGQRSHPPYPTPPHLRLWALFDILTWALIILVFLIKKITNMQSNRIEPSRTSLGRNSTCLKKNWIRILNFVSISGIKTIVGKYRRVQLVTSYFERWCIPSMR